MKRVERFHEDDTLIRIESERINYFDFIELELPIQMIEVPSNVCWTKYRGAAAP